MPEARYPGRKDWDKMIEIEKSLWEHKELPPEEIAEKIFSSIHYAGCKENRESKGTGTQE